jgi:D-glycero-alpha-D-manno-heptose-7-phosphate kinase
MIMTRTPLRISIGGGGTDLPSYYSRFGGFVISAAINRYVYITLHRTFRKNFIIKYSRLEEVDSVGAIQHPIIREAFGLHKMEPYIEMVSMADIPAGTGLGSSGTFNVGLLRAIYAYKREHITTQSLAEEACHIELDLLKEPIGKQDQYIAAFGGLICMDYAKDGTVSVSSLRISRETLHDLEDNLLMFFTGYSRSASNVLSDQKARTEKDDGAMLDNLHFTKELGLKIRQALEEGKSDHFAKLMHEHWLHKKKRSSAISNDQISAWYDLGLANGALGGKLIGAGGGGFLLFYAQDRVALRKAMANAGLVEVRFSFDHEGSKVMVTDS